MGNLGSATKTLLPNQSKFVQIVNKLIEETRYPCVAVVLALRVKNSELISQPQFEKGINRIKNVKVAGCLNQQIYLLYLCEPICISQNRTRAIYACVRDFFSELKRISSAMSQMVMSGKIGVSVLSVDADTVQTAVAHAIQATLEQAMGNQTHVQFFDTDLQRSIKRYILLEDLARNVIDTGDIQVVYQPIIRCMDWQVAGYEVFCRFDFHHSLETNTQEVIELIENMNLVSELDMLAYQTAFRQMASFLKRNDRFLNLNLSPNTRHDLSEFLKCMVALASQEKIDLNRVVIDINEVKSPALSLQFEPLLKPLRELGVSFALDDLKSGFDLPEVLETKQFRYLRLSRKLIEKKHEKNEYYQIIRFLVRLCHRFNVSVIAEGVETREEAQTLSYLGVDYMQGYLFAKPLPYQQLLEAEPKITLELPALYSKKMAGKRDIDEDASTLISIACRSLPRLDPGEPIALADEYLKAGGITYLPVVNKGECVGIVSQALVNLHLTPAMGTEHESAKEASIWQKPVVSLMNTAFDRLDASTPITGLIALLKAQTIAFPIVLTEEQYYKGMVTESEFSHYLMSHLFYGIGEESSVLQS